MIDLECLDEKASVISLRMVRLTLPLAMFAIMLSGHSFNVMAKFVVGLSMLDGIVLVIWQKEFGRGVIRDVVYGILFVMLNWNNFSSSVLMPAPIILTEMLLAYGWRSFWTATAIVGAVLGSRMAQMYWQFHAFPHIGWAVAVGAAILVLAGLGASIMTLTEKLTFAQMHRTRVKETVSAMLCETLTHGKQDVDEAQQMMFMAIVEEMCQSAELETGIKLGRQLAECYMAKSEVKSILTAREREILTLIAEGLSYRKISQQLFVSEGTVRAHAASIMRKAQVHNRNDAIKWAQQERLLP